ncbi:membrane-associated progesterone receptor component 2 [Pseudophryne corroboree]|uniref:membrane-associated progesterone receptor component 2 n=1 Tax=Pseudophryne corroboree TaxID=495146 RepID=UPI00308193CE
MSEGVEELQPAGAPFAREEEPSGLGWGCCLTLLLNAGLLGLLAYGAWRVYRRWRVAGNRAAAPVPRMKRRDFSLQQLRDYDGTKDPHILLAVNGKVFDVTEGSKFYGADGPYGIFAGRDASRGLATFRIDRDVLRDDYDDLSDLNAVQMESVREWEMQFNENYEYVGRLLKPGEEPSEYTDEEDARDHSKQE